MAASERESIEKRLSTLESLLAEYEPTGFRAFRRRIQVLAGLVVTGWVLAGLLIAMPQVRGPVESALRGSVAALVGLVVWLTWELALVFFFPSGFSALIGRILSGLGVVPYFVGAYLIQRTRHMPGVTIAPVPLVLILDVTFAIVMSSPSLGDSDRDKTVGLATEALAWLAYWAQGKWDAPSQAILNGVLEHFRLRRIRRRMHFLRLDEKMPGSDQDEKQPSPSETARKTAEAYLAAARRCNVTDPELALFALLLEGVQTLESLTEEQAEYIETLGKTLGLDEAFVTERLEAARRLARPMSRGQAAELLGVAPDANREEIEKAFQEGMERLGPETVPLLAKARAVLLHGKRRAP